MQFQNFGTFRQALQGQLSCALVPLLLPPCTSYPECYSQFLLHRDQLSGQICALRLQLRRFLLDAACQ
jgi:hypothetical protein